MPEVLHRSNARRDVGDGLCTDQAERWDVHDGEVHGQAVGQVRHAVDRLHGKEDDGRYVVHGPRHEDAPGVGDRREGVKEKLVQLGVDPVSQRQGCRGR